MKKIIFAFFLSFISYFLNVTPAQQIAGFSSVELQSRDLSVPGRVAAQRIIEMESGVVGGRHTHPGEEISYIMEGEATLMVAGQPNRKVKAGEGVSLDRVKLGDRFRATYSAAMAVSVNPVYRE